MHFKTLKFAFGRVSERTDHEDEYTFCSDSIFALSPYHYSGIAKDKAQVLTSFNFLRNAELYFTHDLM